MAEDQENTYLKDQYAHLWESGNKREEVVKEILENEGYTIDFYGFGAGSAGYIDSTAEEEGYEKGDPDLHITDHRVYIEVTGTDVKSVGVDDDLWIRPDKLENAKRNYPDRETWVFHVLGHEGEIRAIKFDQDTAEEYLSDEYTIHEWTRQNAQETFQSIDPSDDCVMSVESALREIAAGIEKRTATKPQ